MKRKIKIENDFEIIELNNYNELPAGVEFVLYEPPFYGDEIHEVAGEFKRKFGNYPQTIYRLGKQLFVVKQGIAKIAQERIKADDKG